MPFRIIWKLVRFAWGRLVASRRRKPAPPPVGVPSVLARGAWQAGVLLSPVLAYHLPGPALIAVIVLAVRRAAWTGTASVGTAAFGSATWATAGELGEADMLADRGGLLLGRTTPRPPPLLRSLIDLFVAPREDSREVTARFWRALLAVAAHADLLFVNHFFNLAAVSPPGGGKGVGMVIPNMRRYRGSVVVLDPKGETYKATADTRARKLGHRVVLFDPLRVTGQPGCRFNPLSPLDPESPTVVDDAAAIADALVVRTGMENENHWNDSAVLALTGFVLYVLRYAPAEERNLNTVCDLITDPREFAAAVKVLQDTDGRLGAEYGRSHLYQSLRRFGNTMSSWIDKELSSILATVGRHLSWTAGPRVRECLAASDVDLADLARTKVSLYMVLPPDKLQTLARLLRLWIVGCFQGLIRNGLQEKNTVLMLLDECGNLGQMKPLREGVTMLRGYGLRCAFILQSLTQMRELFGEHWNTVWSAIDQKVFFGIRDHETAEELSKLIGDTTVRSRSTSTTDRPGPGAIGTFGFGTSDTTHVSTETKRRLITPEEILRAGERDVFVVPSGVPPIKAVQVRYYEEPELFGPVDDAEGSIPPSCDSAVAPGKDRIHFRHACGKRYRLAPGLAGKRAKCVLCKRTLVVPAVSTLPTTPHR